jgi:hypothetical protein
LGDIKTFPNYILLAHKNKINEVVNRVVNSKNEMGWACGANG